MRPRSAVPTPIDRLAPLILTAVLLGSRGAPAQAVAAPSGSSRGAIFQPLLADPKEPQFFAAYLVAHSQRLASRLGSVGFGPTIDLLRARDWQLSIAAGVPPPVNRRSAAAGMINPDYLVRF